MKKQNLILAIILLVTLSTISVFAAEPQVVRVGAFNYYPGIFKDKDGVVKGFYVDALAELGQQENIRFEYVYGSWSEGLERIKTGEIDVLTSVAFTPERAQFLDYPKVPLLTVYGELYAPSSSDIDAIHQVSGKKIAVMKGDFNAQHFIDLVKKFNISCEFVEMPDFDEVFKAVSAKSVDGGVVNSTFGAAKQRDYGLRSTGVVFNPFDIFFVVAKGKNQNLLNLFDIYLSSWKRQENSVFNKSRQKWVHGSINVMTVTPLWFNYFIVAGIILFLVTLIVIAILKKQVRKATASILRSETWFRTMTDGSPCLICVTDAGNRATWFNRRWIEFTGHGQDQEQDSGWLEGIHRDDLVRFNAAFTQASEVRHTYETEIRLRNATGSHEWIAVSGVPVFGHDSTFSGYILYGWIITELKHTGEKLKQNINMLSHILDTVPQAIFWKDVNSVYLGCNRVFAKMAGINEPEDIVGKTDFDLPWSREESEGYRADDRAVMQSNESKYHIIETQHQSDGTIFWVDTTKVPLIDASGSVIGVLGIYENITERKNNEILEDSRRAVLEKIAAGADLTDLLIQITNLVEQELPGSLCSVLLVDESGTHLKFGAAPSLPDEYNLAVHGLRIGQGVGTCGTAAYQQKRVVVEDIEGHPYWKGFKPAQKAGLRSCWSEPIVSTKKLLLGTFAIYYRTPHSPDSAEIAIIESAVHLANIAIERANSENSQRKLNDQIRQMQKIEAIGQLTGGIAHDFNNLLTPMFMFGEMLKKSLGEGSPDLRKVEGILSSANKAKDLTQKLLSFSRKQTLSKDCQDLNGIILSLQDLLRTSIRENIQLDIRLSNTPACIFADKGQMEQILMNLAVNAKDAIAENGVITLQTGHVILDNELVAINPGMKPGPHILLNFSDNGCGMDKKVLDKIFEPFFTTKEIGYGTGLGLATVYGIVKQHDGYITVQSQPGAGTTFSIYFPEHRGKIKNDSTQEAKAYQIPESIVGKTILFVDDNSDITEIVVFCLEDAGFKILSSVTPTGAIELAESHGSSIDLLITDVVMPEMNGPELHERLTTRFPGLPVLFISGYLDGVTLPVKSQQDDINFLHKPFTTEDFLFKVQQALQASLEA